MENIKEESQRLLMRNDIAYINGVELEKAVEIIRHCFFSKEDKEYVEQEVYTIEEFMYIYTKWLKYWNFESCLNEMYAHTDRKVFYYRGNCIVCNCEQAFIVDYRLSEIVNGEKKLNWRERLVCPNCRCNGHERFLIHKIFENYRLGEKILMYEQVTNIFQKVRREIPSVCGFEYPGEGYHGEKEVNGIHCEDICELRFAREEFDFLVVNDVFGLVYDYKRAFKEAYRVLKVGGKLIFTVPFDGNNVETMHCVELTQEGMKSIGAWYYGNPVDASQPRPVCQIFGWNILDVMKDCGFKKVCGKVYYGLEEGYMGYLPIYFEAYK